MAIDKLVLVGGASLAPCVREAVERLVRPPHQPPAAAASSKHTPRARWSGKRQRRREDDERGRCRRAALRRSCGRRGGAAGGGRWAWRRRRSGACTRRRRWRWARRSSAACCAASSVATAPPSRWSTASTSGPTRAASPPRRSRTSASASASASRSASAARPSPAAAAGAVRCGAVRCGGGLWRCGCLHSLRATVGWMAKLLRWPRGFVLCGWRTQGGRAPLASAPPALAARTARPPCAASGAPPRRTPARPSWCGGTRGRCSAAHAPRRSSPPPAPARARAQRAAANATTPPHPPQPAAVGSRRATPARHAQQSPTEQHQRGRERARGVPPCSPRAASPRR
eukprot:scaffold1679_cov254-Prasinococcus_capsulatus_cf.AAC.4